ncbi:mitochondrial matrix iron-sulfur protein [Pyricularia oryzae]|uniref:Mitochondrial matrix iron-sulfur protein n=1 Tax=Pyricularia grisea TaxID=148305 RepID=A0ABQ8NK99_PYRGI|nr:mitochondrial matrix iron-sulfur protein [Pyricularia oryzae]KAI6298332.1 mitochondrial matrix iron-sulfur protein [Pyricularia grisea]KAH9428548.1 mitochondrial matrix iron-sulfur protein [Pyricularia oryzae]KAI6262793.1 mitochondrial matrix iron-sulfur protein [Pyricularia oryzae]KAI6270423.1 mitochondrial matrix iron-sulfur protein [Pyricularia oryzae]
MSASNVFASSLRACRVAARQTAARVPAPRTSGSFLATARPARVSRQPTIFSLAKRSLSTTATRMHGHVTPPKPGEELYITFIDKDDMEHKLAVSAGDNLLDIAQAHDLEMEGACGGSCACSTCHVIVLDDKYYDAMPEPEDDENDMLDLAFGLTETSRLGCQVTMTKALDGMKVKLPSMTRNLQASDFK